MLDEKSIEEFIQEYKRSRVIIETTVRATLKRAAEWEEVLDKPFYNFTKEEILKMYTDAKAISNRSLQNQNLTLSHAAKYFLYHAGQRVIEEYETITKEDLEKCVVKRDLISREELNEIQMQLLNATDSGILEMFYLGLGGEWSKELTFFSSKQISKKNWCMFFKNGKAVPINHNSYEIIMAACNEKELISYGEEHKVISVTGDGVYKRRGNTIRDNNNIKDQEDLERKYRYLQRRLKEVNKYLGLKLTPGLLQTSGFWHYANEEMKRMEISDFKEYLYTKNGKKMAARYNYHSRFYIQVLLDKYKNYL